MQFSFTDEQEQFRAVVQRFVRDKSPTTEVRRLMHTAQGFDREVWRQLCEDLGLAGLHVPETYGGAGFGFVEVGIVVEEMGRSLLCSPYFGSSILATSAILHGASEAQKQALLPSLASGKKIACLALAEASGHWNCDSIELTAEPSGNEFVLNGQKKFVLDGQVADWVIVAARQPGTSGADGIGLFVVEGTASGLQRRALDTIDETRKLAELDFDRVSAQALNDSGDAVAAIARTLDDGAIALANEMVGGAQALLDSVVEYAQLRMQFGRVIGSFQAVKHKCAEMLLDVELAKSAAYYAAEARAENDPDVPALASLAKATTADAYMRTAIESIQLHGGIGFTWDHDTHLWFKRAKSSEVLLEDPSYHRERYISLQEELA
ncbi:MAG: alkylation response protein AidB-like acyl-CoA dehydrogenase [Gammaproteobacteria bacterium]|jgi:alkylation response protein AidB-like acyl-CoA dehydrogenase